MGLAGVLEVRVWQLEGLLGVLSAWREDQEGVW